MASEELENRISNIEQIIGIIPKNKDDIEARLDAIERYINSEQAGTVSNIVYKAVDEEGNVTSEERFKLVDADAVNRLRAYVDSFIKQNITEKLTSDIKKDIKNIKNYLGYKDKEDTNITELLQNLIEEVYSNSSEIDSSSRLDTLEQNIENIARILNEEANIEVELTEYDGDFTTRIEKFEKNLKSIIEVLKYFGYDISTTGAGFTMPKNGEYLSTDSKGRIIAEASAEELQRGNFKLVTSDVVATALRESISNGDYAKLGITELNENIDWTQDDLWGVKKFNIPNGQTTFFKEFFVDTTGKNASFTAHSEDEPTEWPWEINENTIIYIPIHYSGKLTITSYYGNFFVQTYGGKKIVFEKTAGDNNYLAEFDFSDGEIISDTRYIKIYCTSKDYIKEILYTFSEDFCMKINKKNITTTVPLVDPDGNMLVSKLKYANLTKAEVGLDKVNNTTDYDKPISVYQQEAFDTEKEARIKSDEEITNSLNTKTENLEKLLNEKITAEENSRIENDNNLTEALRVEAEARISEDTNINDALKTEAETRAKNNQELSNKLDNEIRARTDFMSNMSDEFDKKIEDEASSRQSEDVKIDNRLKEIESHVPNTSEGYTFATTKNVADAIASVINGADESFDTLKEIAEWISSDEAGNAAAAERIMKLENETNRQKKADTYLQNLLEIETNNRIQNVKDVENRLASTIEQEAKNNEDLKNTLNDNISALDKKITDEITTLNTIAEAKLKEFNNNSNTADKALSDRLDVVEKKNTNISYEDDVTTISKKLKLPNISEGSRTLTSKLLGYDSDGNIIPAYARTTLVNHHIKLFDNISLNQVAELYLDSLEESKYTKAEDLPTFAAVNVYDYIDPEDNNINYSGLRVVKNGKVITISSLKSTDGISIKKVDSNYSTEDLNIVDEVYPSLDVVYEDKTIDNINEEQEVEEDTLDIKLED